jgi:hypothetical protein
MMATRRRRHQGADEQLISVVLPDEPPVLTSQAAGALLRLLQNVHHRNEYKARPADGSAAARTEDHDNKREAA